MIMESMYVLWCDNCILIIQLVDVFIIDNWSKKDNGMIMESMYILWCDNCLFLIQLVDVLFITITLTPGVELLYIFVHID